jgi:hypothetical protein
MSASLRRLTNAGREVYLAWLTRKDGSAPPRLLLTDSGTSEPVAPGALVPDPPFQNRFELGAKLAVALRDLDKVALRSDAGIWDWLSLHYIDLICPDEQGKGRKIGEVARYALDLRHVRQARHLVRMSWSLVRDPAQNARFMLSGPLHVHGDIVEQLATRDQVIGSRKLIAAAALLWWDEAKGTYKPGINNRDRRKGGTIRRLVTVAEQFRMTYDFDSMEAKTILALLPHEFERWREDEPPIVPKARPAPRKPKGWLDGMFDRL